MCRCHVQHSFSTKGGRGAVDELEIRGPRCCGSARVLKTSFTASRGTRQTQSSTTTSGPISTATLCGDLAACRCVLREYWSLLAVLVQASSAQEPNRYATSWLQEYRTITPLRTQPHVRFRINALPFSSPGDDKIAAGRHLSAESSCLTFRYQTSCRES